MCVTFQFRIGLGTLLSGAHFITDGMLQAAAEWYLCDNMVLASLLHREF